MDRKNRGLNIRWLMENADKEAEKKGMPINNGALAPVLGYNSATQAWRVSSGRSQPPDEKLERFIVRTKLRDRIPGIEVTWFDLDTSIFAERMRLLGEGRWQSVAGLDGWLGTLPPLPNGRLLPEEDLRLRLQPTVYRSDFGDAPEPDDVVPAVARIGGRYGIAVDVVPDPLRSSLKARMIQVVLLHRAIPPDPDDPRFKLVDVDPRLDVHFVAADEAAMVQGTEGMMILAKQHRERISTRYGFEVGGVTGRRELALFMFGTASDLPDEWSAGAQDGKLSPDYLLRLRDAVARAAEQNGTFYGRLLFDAVP